MRRNSSITLLAVGHACVDVYQGAVAALVPFFVAERAYSYAAVSGIVLAASLLSSVAQPVFGALTDRWATPWLLPLSTLLSGVGIALSGVTGHYGLTLVFVAVSGIGVAAYHPESARVARLASRGSHAAMGWFSLGGSLGFALAPLMVAAVVATGGLRLTPLLVLPALAGAVTCLPVLRLLGQRQAAAARTAVPGGADDTASFVRLSLVVVCRSIVYVGLSTFIALYAKQSMHGGTVAGTAALFVLYLGGAVGSVLGGTLANRWARVTVARWAYLIAVGTVAGVVFVPGLAMYPFVALTSAALYVPFSLQVTLGQDYLPSRIGTASGITLGLTVSIGGLVSPVIGSLADATSLRTALAPLVLIPGVCWILARSLPEPQAVTGSAGAEVGAADDEPDGAEGHRGEAQVASGEDQVEERNPAARLVQVMGLEMILGEAGDGRAGVGADVRAEAVQRGEVEFVPGRVEQVRSQAGSDRDPTVDDQGVVLQYASGRLVEVHVQEQRLDEGGIAPLDAQRHADEARDDREHGGERAPDDSAECDADREPADTGRDGEQAGDKQRPGLEQATDADGGLHVRQVVADRGDGRGQGRHEQAEQGQLGPQPAGRRDVLAPGQQQGPLLVLPGQQWHAEKHADQQRHVLHQQ
jgi:MFS transporter, FSR family, fosmidomycin resistance protein